MAVHLCMLHSTNGMRMLVLLLLLMMMVMGVVKLTRDACISNVSSTAVMIISSFKCLIVSNVAVNMNKPLF